MSTQGFLPFPQTGWAGRLSSKDFNDFREFFSGLLGLHLPPSKRMLVASRLGRRIAFLGLGGFGEYHKLLCSPAGRDEIQHAVDLITTNETSFFREPEHFRILEERIIPSFTGRSTLHVWCGASSTGEEPYSLAMVLRRALGPSGWVLDASEVNSEVLECARKGLYTIDRAAKIPPEFLQAYCRKGIGDYAGTFLVCKELRERIHFRKINLLDLPSSLEHLDVVFLRNVLIYFDAKVRQEMLTSVVDRIRPGGWLVMGHSESLVGLRLPPLDPWKPSVYRKPEGPD